VPTDAEWSTLETYLGGASAAGAKLKESGNTHWISPYGSTNETGFTALPGGYRLTNGPFTGITSEGGWWASTTVSSYAYFMQLYYYSTYTTITYTTKQIGYSIRCVKD
jgi:uncharacterized protein (TIGR02145 family)